MSQATNETVQKNAGMPAPKIAPNQAVSFSASFASVRSRLLAGRPPRRPNRNRPLEDIERDERDAADARKAIREDVSESYTDVRRRLGIDD
jgi:hypothetical protein